MGKLNQDFSKWEEKIINMFPENSSFEYKGNKYNVILSGKPRPAKGECKTDVYIKAKDDNGNEKEWKISVKKDNADFLENKIGLERAKEIFGENAQEIIKKSIAPIQESFNKTPLIYYKKYRKTDALCITLGWKFELTNKQSGDKSAELKLKDDEKIDIYAGTNLSIEKKNCRVGDEKVTNSGVANYYLEVNPSMKNAQDIIDGLVDIETHTKSISIYFACKALNYRLKENKWDGDRPLSIYIDWKIKEGNLYGECKYDNPLSKKGNEIGNNVKKLLNKLKINPDSVTENELKKVIHKDVSTYG